MRRRVTFSRNFTLSLSRHVPCYCKYCAFATHQAHLHAPDEVERAARPGGRGAAPRSCSSSPARSPRSTRSSPSACARYGHDGLHRLRRVGVRARARARAAAAHEPRRPEPRGPRAAARGHRVAGADARVGQRAPDADRPRRARRRSTRRGAWRRSAPPASCGSRSPAASSSASARRADERIASLEALAAVHAEHGHLQEVILQNFVPHRALLRRGAGGDRRRERARATGRTGIGDRPEHAAAGLGLRGDDRRHEAT